MQGCPSIERLSRGGPRKDLQQDSHQRNGRSIVSSARQVQRQVPQVVIHQGRLGTLCQEHGDHFQVCVRANCNHERSPPVLVSFEYCFSVSSTCFQNGRDCRYRRFLGTRCMKTCSSSSIEMRRFVRMCLTTLFNRCPAGRILLKFLNRTRAKGSDPLVHGAGFTHRRNWMDRTTPRRPKTVFYEFVHIESSASNTARSQVLWEIFVLTRHWIFFFGIETAHPTVLLRCECTNESL